MARFGFGMGFGSQSSAFAPLLGLVTRNFTTSTSGGSESWPLDSSVSLTGAFSITDDVATTSTAAGVLYSGGTAAGKLEVSLTAAGLVQVDVAGVTIFTGVVAVNDGKLNTLVLSRTGTTASLTVNGVSDGSGTMSGTVAFDTLDARTAGSVFFIGTHANIVVVDAGTGIHSWPIDEADPSTITDRTGSNDSTAVNFTSADSEEFTQVGADWLGAEVVVNGGFDTDSDWTKGSYTTISDGKAKFNDAASPGTFNNLTQSGVMTSGLIYILTFSISELSAGSVKFTSFSSSVPVASTNGDFSFIGDSSTATVSFQRNNGGGENIFNMDDVAIKRILEAP